MQHEFNHSPCALVILDGFGFSPQYQGNAIAHSNMPTWKKLLQNYPHTYLEAAGQAVGLLPSFIGNSEVGHLTLGAGRIIPSVLKQFHEALTEKSLEFNPILNKQFSLLAHEGGRLHLMGLLSDGGVHSHEAHLFALLERSVQLGVSEIFVHAFLDGRDVAPQSASLYLKKLEAFFLQLGKGKLASIQGRFYAMDRDQNWDRTKQSYRMLTGQLSFVDRSWQNLIEQYYAQQITDEFIPPTLLQKDGFIRPGDGVLFFNFRPDRARQLSEAFLSPNFQKFERTIIRKDLKFFITTTRYDENFKYWNNDILFEEQQVQSTLLDELHTQTHGRLKVFIIAETEKQAHVTYFFRGMRKIKKPQEIYIFVPSIKSKNYIQHPEMSASKITKQVIQSLKNDPAHFYLINYANADMVGHSGDFYATVKACEVIDQQLAQLYEEFITKRNGTLFITADHGNAEYKIDPTTEKTLTAHTKNPVPFVIVNKEFFNHGYIQKDHWGLKNVSPTILSHLGLVIPQEMTKEIQVQQTIK